MNFDSILDAVNKPAPSAPGDYIGTDGLLFCGKCRTPKQTRIGGKILSCLCQCGVAEREESEKKARQARITELRKSCLPIPAMWGHTFETAMEAKHITVARRYVAKWDQIRRDNIGLLLWGNTGSGKSFTAHCICNALIDNEIPVVYLTAIDLVARLMDRNTDRDAFLQRIQTAPLFALDDLGAERNTAFALEQLCSIIDIRNETGKPLLVTTNYTLQEMREAKDHQQQRIFDRLKCCTPLAIVGQSRRDAVGAAKLEAAKTILELD